MRLFICNPATDLSSFEIFNQKVFPLRASLFCLEHLGVVTSRKKVYMLEPQRKFPPERHKQVLSESHGRDLPQVSVTIAVPAQT